MKGGGEVECKDVIEIGEDEGPTPNVKCQDCGRVESPPYCDGDNCLCGGVLRNCG